MDYDFLVNLRRNHPAWRLLAADSAPFVTGFLYQSFVRSNVRVFDEQELTTRLDDYLFYVRQHSAENGPSKSARDYLHDWADPARGWLRRYYPAGSDEPLRHAESTTNASASDPVVTDGSLNA